MPWVPKCRYRDAAIRAEERLASHSAGWHLLSFTEPEPNDSRVVGRDEVQQNAEILKSTSSSSTQSSLSD